MSRHLISAAHGRTTEIHDCPHLLRSETTVKGKGLSKSAEEGPC